MSRAPRLVMGAARWVPLVLVVVLAPACALLTKSDPIVPRYFSPEGVASAPAAAHPPTSGLELRLGRVNSDSYIRDKIVRRESAYEVTCYEERYWTEKPETYVRRALTRALFDERGVRQVLSGIATTLNVDVVAFEEVMKPEHVGRVELAYVLYDDRVVLQSRTVTVERPIAEAKGDDSLDAVVRALASAMSAAVGTIADASAGELRAEADKAAGSSKVADAPAR